ncbi:MAG: patatin family protein [Acholeplasmatales bacterium]|nr:patatin family protein [Acholeplasmatales bacterium]
MKKFEYLDKIKKGDASDNITDGLLLLQGGAFRGVYTSGVLDCLMNNDINLSTCIGISAGALNGVNYIAGNIGRAALINLGHRHDSAWVGLKAFRDKKNNGFIGFNFCFNQFNKEYPLNTDRFFNGGRRFICGATSLKEGTIHYFENNNEDIFKAVMASSSMPYISKPVKIGNDLYLDGGCNDSIPIKYALTFNKKTLVVLTRELGYRVPLKTKRIYRRRDNIINHSIYGKYPNFIQSLQNMDKIYNIDFELIEELYHNKEIMVIAPSHPLNDIGRLEGDMSKLGALYYLGYSDALNKLKEIREFFEIDKKESH